MSKYSALLINVTTKKHDCICSPFYAHKITLTILGILRFNVNGVTYFIFEADNTLLWPLGAAITDVRVASPLSGYSNDSLVISGKENPVSLQLNYRIGQV